MSTTKSSFIPKSGTMLEKLEDERVFSVRVFDGRIYLTECCDQCFTVEMTPQEVYMLAKEILDIAHKTDPKLAV